MKAKKTLHKFVNSVGRHVLPDKVIYDFRGAEIYTKDTRAIKMTNNIWSGNRGQCYICETIHGSDVYKAKFLDQDG